MDKNLSEIPRWLGIHKAISILDLTGTVILHAVSTPPKCPSG